MNRTANADRSLAGWGRLGLTSGFLSLLFACAGFTGAAPGLSGGPALAFAAVAACLCAVGAVFVGLGVLERRLSVQGALLAKLAEGDRAASVIERASRFAERGDPRRRRA